MTYKVKDAKGLLRISTPDYQEAIRKFNKVKLISGYARIEVYEDIWDKPITVYGG